MSRAALLDLDGKLLRHAVIVVAGKVDAARLQDGDAGKLQLHPRRGGEHAALAREHVAEIADVADLLSRVVGEEVKGAVQRPAVALERRIAARRVKYLVVQLRGLAIHALPARRPRAVNDVGVNEVNDGPQQDAPRVAGDRRTVSLRGLNHAASPPAG